DAMIVGGGDTTHYLCEILNRSGIAVKVIEKEQARCEELSEKLDYATVINADAIDQQVLYEEGIENTGAFIALTNLDEENILLSLFARSVNKGKLVTKINRIDFDDVIRHLELDTIIYPKNITAESIVRYVRAMKNTIGSNVETLYSIIKGKVDAAEFIIKDNSPVIEKPLMEMKIKPSVLVASIMRDRKPLIPRGSDKIMVGDSVIIVSDFPLHDIAEILEN
ncbi:MAG: NAD-binding protein, partial [Ruminiclostridium sp.]|nr:NAD-binding protein [Ruminiclostridium sp.]